MLLRASICLLVAGLLGCSFIEELDSANEEMNRYSPTARKEAEAKAAAEAAAPTAPTGPTTSETRLALKEWWQNARTIGSGPKDESIVRCTVGGSVQFMRVHDCEMRGGTATR